MANALERAVLAEYGSLDPLRVRIETHQRHSELPDDVEANVLASAQLAPEHDVLDVGFGTGDFLANQRPRPGRLTGVDTSAAAVAAIATIGGLEAIVGSAVALPLRDGSYDRVFARHMLYHVAEPSLALAEFRRVTRIGGLVIASVNHRQVLPRTMDLIDDAIRRHVAEPDTPAMIAVHSDNLPPMMEAAFGATRVQRFDNHLRFDEPAPLIRMAGALTSMRGLPSASPMYGDVMQTVAERVRAWFQRHDGPWRDPKGYSVCVSAGSSGTG